MYIAWACFRNVALFFWTKVLLLAAAEGHFDTAVENLGEIYFRKKEFL